MKKNMETKKHYIVPEIVVVTFKAEHGFANSGGVQNSVLDLFFLQQEDGYNSQAQQNWQEEEGFFGNW